MKNLFKFFLFVALLSLGISALYDYRLKHGALGTLQRAPEKYTLAKSANVDPKQVASLEALNQEISEDNIGVGMKLWSKIRSDPA
jgi:hypothetical protein